MSQHHHWVRSFGLPSRHLGSVAGWASLSRHTGNKVSQYKPEAIIIYFGPWPFVHLPWRCSRSNTAWALLQLAEVAWPTQCLSQNISVPVRLKMSPSEIRETLKVPSWALTLLKSSTARTFPTARRLAFLGPPRLTVVELIQYQAEHLGIEFQMSPILAYYVPPSYLVEFDGFTTRG
jgi:hypothetical protein